MASTSSRRGMSHRTLERQHTRADDPWCLVCGVNLALDGRTFSIVSGQQNSDLSDVLVRVLGMKFTDDNASVNVCNRCERHLKRIGRTANTASARNEGRQFREQAEKNMVKNFQAGVELGDYREPTFSSAPAANSSKTTREATATSAVKRGTTFDTNPSARNARDQYSRSTSVRFDDEKEVKKGAPNRDHSVPERVAQKRERDLMSSWDESKSKEVRRGTRTGAPSVERGMSTRANSIDQRTATEKRGQQRVSVVKETTRSITRTNTVDGSKKSSKVSIGQISPNNGESDNATSHGDKQRPDGGISPLPAPRKKQTAGVDADLPELSPTQTNPFLFDDQATEDDKHFDNSGHFDNDTPTPFEEDVDHPVDEKDYLHSKDNFEDIEESVLRDDNHAFAALEQHTRHHHDNEEPITNSSPTQDYKTLSNNERRNSERSDVTTEDLAEDEEKNQARKPKVTFSESVLLDETRDEHENVAPAPTSATVLNDKGKLLKYESLDLEIDNSNPFFDDVYGEYNRRVYVSSRIWNIGSPNSRKRESQKPEAIPEDEDGDDSQRARVELGSSETAETVSGSGENHQDSTPLIGDNEENKEENKDVEDDHESNIHPDKTSDVNGSAEQPQKGRENGQEDEEREDGEAEGHKHEEDSEVIVKEVIQPTHLAPLLNHGDADTDRSDGVSLETSSPGAQNDSQISQQPGAQTEDARAVKSEASPLIDKDEDISVKKGKRPVDSRLRDQNPGFACCNVL